MTKALPLCVLLLCTSAFAKTTCVNNRDQNGNVCTNFSTNRDTYSPYSGYTYYIDYEDGKADPPDFTGAIEPESYYIYVDIPFDPLKIEGIVPRYGSDSTDLEGTVSSFSRVNGGVPPKIWYIETWNFVGAANIAAGTYPYTWSGTFSVTWTCTRWNYRYRQCSAFTAGEGHAEMSAIHN